MLKIEVQYFNGCPNADVMIRRIKEAISIFAEEVDCREVIVDTPKKAQKYKFRRSPTVLINGIDLEGLPEPTEGNLSCRYYKDGVPSVETIINIIENSSNKAG